MRRRPRYNQIPTPTPATATERIAPASQLSWWCQLASALTPTHDVLRPTEPATTRTASTAVSPATQGVRPTIGVTRRRFARFPRLRVPGRCAAEGETATS